MSEERLEHVKGALSEYGGFCDALATEKEKLAAQEAAAEHTQLHAAMVEAAYIIALADGEVSQTEADALADGMYQLTDISQENLSTLYDVAVARVQNEGKDARIAALAGDLASADLRRGAFLVAAAVSWKDGGIGVKQGLALQALARAFDIPTPEMHKLLAKAHG